MTDLQLIEKIAHEKAVEAAACSMFMCTAMFNSIAAQPEVDQRKFASDMVHHLTQMSQQFGTDNPVAKIMMETLSNGIISGMAGALGRASEDEA